MFANFVVIVIWILSHRPGRESKLLKNPLSESNLAGGSLILDQEGSLILVQGGKFAWRTGSTRTGFSIDWSKIGKTEYMNAMIKSAANSADIKRLLKNALTDEIKSREMFMKGIDYSYYYEE